LNNQKINLKNWPCPPSITEKRLQKLQQVKTSNKKWKEVNKNNMPLQWVFLGQIAYCLHPCQFSVSIICIGEKKMEKNEYELLTTKLGWIISPSF
jgi:hypothetical protein